MARPKPWEVDDELWAVVEPLLPKVERRTRHPGRKRHPDRLVFQGILFVLHTGVAWEHLPQELGFGSGMTCWRRLAEWTEAGVWPRLHEVLLARLRGANALDFSRAAVDGSHIRALKGGPKTGRSPVDRGRAGSKHHLITDATGIPLAATLTGGNRNDVTQLIPLLQAVPPVRGKRGRPRRRPDTVLGDRGYDHDKYRRLVWELGVKPLIARRGTEHGSGLGTHRWVVERAFAHLHWFRRLRIRWEIRDDIHEAFLTLGCALICWRRLKSLR
ncbi:IS5 family transposase [Streptomyces bauhiniae]|uniref:IS5 family transposase n=1 Tax=Streptomyces bauhiniae TaxID=2340725 RepID=A0A7K3QWD1_9ACTN|nr:IS5 family transposase [Streptomyces bauhiniae]NEB91387.1 IS5 family transposase [Streptomyces bauhiniae]NEB94163.1 IS5 family transposase [Streptomyces bauhiniae]